MNVKCPKCEGAPPLLFQQHADHPRSYGCNTCEGQFLPANTYISWQQRRGEILPEKPGSAGQFEFDDTERALLCPTCNGIMMKYRVRNDLPFQVDFCRRCNGVWLDRNEWDALFARNLHDEINFIFTEGWQSKLNRERLDIRMDALFKKRLGQGAYEHVVEFRDWLIEQDHRAEIVAWLSDQTQKND